MNEENMKQILGDAIAKEHIVGEPEANEIKKQLKRYEKLDAETEEYSNALPEKFESEYDEKSGNLIIKSKVKLSPEEQRIADKAVEMIARDYGVVIKKLDEYERLEAEAEEIAEEDKVYRKKIVK